MFVFLSRKENRQREKKKFRCGEKARKCRILWHDDDHPASMLVVCQAVTENPGLLWLMKKRAKQGSFCRS
jgi:hypothetical protein